MDKLQYRKEEEGDKMHAVEKKQLMSQLQSLRLLLYEVVKERGSFTDPKVIEISEAADKLILALQNIERKDVQKIKH